MWVVEPSTVSQLASISVFHNSEQFDNPIIFFFFLLFFLLKLRSNPWLLLVGVRVFHLLIAPILLPFLFHFHSVGASCFFHSFFRSAADSSASFLAIG